MRTALIGALFASSIIAAAPAAAQNGKAYGHEPKVCLLTFSVAGSTADADVVKAQYLPLPIALKLEARNDAFADIYTYNETTTFTGVDNNVPSPSDPALGIEPDMTTEEVCNLFMDFVDDNDDDDDD